MWSSVKHPPPPPCSRTLQCISLHLHLLGPVEPSLNMVAGIACSPPCWYKNLMRAQVFRWQHNMSVYPYYKPWLAQVFLCQIILSCCPVVSTKRALPDIDGLWRLCVVIRPLSPAVILPLRQVRLFLGPYSPLYRDGRKGLFQVGVDSAPCWLAIHATKDKLFWSPLFTV